MNSGSEGEKGKGGEVGRGAAHTKKPERVPLSGFGFMFLDSVWEGVSTIPRYTTLLAGWTGTWD